MHWINLNYSLEKLYQTVPLQDANEVSGNDPDFAKN